MAREELLDSQLVSVILVESQCAGARNGKAIAMNLPTTRIVGRFVAILIVEVRGLPRI